MRDACCMMVRIDRTVAGVVFPRFIYRGIQAGGRLQQVGAALRAPPGAGCALGSAITMASRLTHLELTRNSHAPGHDNHPAPASLELPD